MFGCVCVSKQQYAKAASAEQLESSTDIRSCDIHQSTDTGSLLLRVFWSETTKNQENKSFLFTCLFALLVSLMDQLSLTSQGTHTSALPACLLTGVYLSKNKMAAIDNLSENKIAIGTLACILMVTFNVSLKESQAKVFALLQPLDRNDSIWFSDLCLEKNALDFEAQGHLWKSCSSYFTWIFFLISIRVTKHLNFASMQLLSSHYIFLCFCISFRFQAPCRKRPCLHSTIFDFLACYNSKQRQNHRTDSQPRTYTSRGKQYLDCLQQCDHPKYKLNH